MTRTEKFKDYRENIHKQTLGTIDYNLDYIGDKLNEISNHLESQSSSLYQIAKYDIKQGQALDNLLGMNPIEELENLFDEIFHNN